MAARRGGMQAHYRRGEALNGESKRERGWEWQIVDALGNPLTPWGWVAGKKSDAVAAAREQTNALKRAAKAKMHREMAVIEFETEERRCVAEEKHRQFLRNAPPPTAGEGFLARAAEAGVPGAAQLAAGRVRYFR